MSKLIMMVGLPGSGKTTYAKHLASTSRNVVIHSSDAIRKEIYGTEKEQGDPERVFNLLHKRAAIDLRCGKDVIYDATNIKSDDRKRAIQAITTDFLDVEKIAIIMDTEVVTCKDNNTSRHRHVPIYAFERMLASFSRPDFSEGFDQIISVQQKQKDTIPNTKIASAGASSAFIEYTGVFLEGASLYALVSEKIGDLRLHQNVLSPHITFQYMPQMIRDDLFGEKAEFRVVGYGKDELNEGLLVEWQSGSLALKKEFARICIPHITLSFSDYGHAVNTRYLDFKPIVPFTISGTFGGFTKSGDCPVFTRRMA